MEPPPASKKLGATVPRRRPAGRGRGDELEISVDGDRIILQKRQDVCLFCSAENPELEFKHRRICSLCASEFVAQTPLSQASRERLR